MYGNSSNNETDLPYDPAIPLWDKYSKESKSGAQRDICALMFIELFTVAKKVKQ
jgi:hypothetical protein